MGTITLDALSIVLGVFIGTGLGGFFHITRDYWVYGRDSIYERELD